MRTMMFATLVAATVLPGAGTAYADTPAQQRAELRQDRREIRQDQREVHRDVARGDWREARQDRRELREDQRDRREDRRDAREHWRDYREHNRQVYRRPVYAGPAGYRYQAWRPGWRLPVAYYAPRYVIADPGYYRLERPRYGYMRWVRYGDDVLLVDMRNGLIRDVIHDFFW